jgi:HSP20 family protein
MSPELTRHGRYLATPRTLFPSLRDEMDRLSRMFDEFFGREELAPSLTMWGPPMDVAETDDKVMVRADIPGIDPKELDISISGDVLTVKGEKKEEKEEKGEAYFCSERRYGAFSRTIDLPTNVDPEKIDASYHNGVLKIEMKKLPEAKRKKIQVKG